MKLTPEQIKVPENYFQLSEEEKIDVCVGLLETIYEVILRNNHTKHSKVELMETILDATLKFNEELEEFEHCQVLYDTRKLLNEHKGR